MGFGGKIKRTQADKHLSDCVRKSAEWKCQRCEKDYTDKPQGLQCSHFLSRMHYGTRYDPRQLSLCAYCHNTINLDSNNLDTNTSHAPTPAQACTHSHAH